MRSPYKVEADAERSPTESHGLWMLETTLLGARGPWRPNWLPCWKPKRPGSPILAGRSEVAPKRRPRSRGRQFASASEGGGSVQLRRRDRRLRVDHDGNGTFETDTARIADTVRAALGTSDRLPKSSLPVRSGWWQTRPVGIS